MASRDAVEVLIESLREEVDRLRKQIHRERNEAAVEYGKYELTIRKLKEGK